MQPECFIARRAGKCKANCRGYVGVDYVWTDWERCNEVDNLSETIQMRNFCVRRRLGVKRTPKWTPSELR